MYKPFSWGIVGFIGNSPWLDSDLTGHHDGEWLGGIILETGDNS